MSVAECGRCPTGNASALGVVSEGSLRLEVQDVVCADRHTLVLSGEVDIASVALLATEQWAAESANSRRPVTHGGIAP